MRTTLAVLLLLLSLGYLAATLDLPAAVDRSRSEASQTATAEGVWRRTAAGWELHTSWSRTTDQPVAWCEALANVHPLVVASLQLLLSLGGLVAWTQIPVRPSRQTQCKPAQ